MTQEVTENGRTDAGREANTGAAGTENTNGNRGGDSGGSKVSDYIAGIRQRSANGQKFDAVSPDQRAENGRNVRADEAGTRGDDRGTGNVPDSNGSRGRDSGAANTSSGRGRKSNSSVNSGRATNDTGLTIVIPAAAKDDKKKSSKPSAVVLTEKEVKEMQSDFTGFLRILFEWMDDAISFTNKDRAQADIWKAIDEEDTGKIASAVLSLAKRRSSVAVAVRAISNSYVYYEAGLISSQKVMETFLFYREHHGFSIPGVF